MRKAKENEEPESRISLLEDEVHHLRDVLLRALRRLDDLEARLLPPEKAGRLYEAARIARIARKEFAGSIGENKDGVDKDGQVSRL